MIFALRRLRQGGLTLALVCVSVFMLTQIIGDPVNMLLPLEATDAQRQALRSEFGFDESILTQFQQYAADLARLDFGTSAYFRVPVWSVIIERLGETLILSGAAMTIALAVALPLGLAAATRPNSLFDRITSALGLLTLSIPAFWLGLLLILVFAVQLRWVPTSGQGTLTHLILPSITLALAIVGRVAIFSREVLREQLGKPWVAAAHVRGLSRPRVLVGHGLRNAAVPIATVSGWEFIRMLTGRTVLVEAIFAWPGLGLAALEAIEGRDLFLLRGIVIVTAMMVIATNTATDLVYRRIDSRVDIS